MVGTVQRDYGCTSDQACVRLEAETLRGLVARLSSAERQVIDLAYWSGLSRSHIAEVFDLPIGTVTSRVRADLTKLRSEGPGDFVVTGPLIGPA